jgi:hypothetical protein
MIPSAERMKAMRSRRSERGVREIRLTAPDTRSAIVRERIAVQCARLGAGLENEAMAWIEAVSEFDEPALDAAR